jgi:hypothetical protein
MSCLKTEVGLVYFEIFTEPVRTETKVEQRKPKKATPISPMQIQPIHSATIARFFRLLRSHPGPLVFTFSSEKLTTTTRRQNGSPGLRISEWIVQIVLMAEEQRLTGDEESRN